MHISWQPGFSPSRKPVKRSRARRIKGGLSGNADGSQQFEFIAEQPVGNPGPRHSLLVTASTHSDAPVTITTDRQTSPDLNGVDLSLANCPKNQDSIVSDESEAHSQVEVPAAISDLTNVSRSPSASIPPSILYNNLSQRFRPILDRCMLILHHVRSCHSPLTNSRRSGILQNPIDVRPTCKSVPMPHRPRLGTHFFGSRCDGFSESPRQECIHSESSSCGTPTAPQGPRYVR